MDDSKNPKLIKNGGNGTIVGNALRFLVEQGKTISPAILELAGSVTGVKQLDTLADAIRGDKEMSETDKKLLLSNLVRPVTYMLFSVVFFSLVFFDGNIGSFTVNEVYVPVIETLFSTMTIFYFGSRGIEKVAKTLKK